MSLTNLSQIKGGAQLQKDVAALLKSYDAAKVLTNVAKGEGDDSYNVNELLQELKGKIDAISGHSGEGVSLESLTLAIAGKADNDAVETIDTRVKAIEDAQEVAVSDLVAVTEAVSKFALSKKPNEKLVEMIINHLVYVEGEDFTVDRETQEVTWTLTAANGGFDIDADLAEAVRFNYFAKSL